MPEICRKSYSNLPEIDGNLTEINFPTVPTYVIGRRLPSFPSFFFFKMKETSFPSFPSFPSFLFLKMKETKNSVLGRKIGFLAKNFLHFQKNSFIFLHFWKSSFISFLLLAKKWKWRKWRKFPSLQKISRRPMGYYVLWSLSLCQQTQSQNFLPGVRFRP